MMIQRKMITKLTAALSPSVLDVINESYMHKVPKDAETHFKVIVVSAQFDGLTLIAKHRKVNDILADELKNHIHALSIQAFTPEQWLIQKENIPVSPACLGGSLVDKH